MKSRRQSFYYGWLIAAAAWFCYVMLTAVTTYCSSVVTTHLILDRMWSESVVGYQSALQYASIAVFSIPTGVMARKRGCRLPYTLSALIGGSVFLIMFLTNAPQGLYVGAFFILGISICMGGQVTAPIITDAWFDRRKSLATAIVMTGGGIGGFFLPQLAERLYAAGGVRTCWIVMSILEFSALIPIILIMKNHPEDIGEIKDGRLWVSGHPASDRQKMTASSGKTLRESCLTRSFVTVAAGNTIFRITQTVFIAYAMIHMIHMGLSSATAVTVISCSNVVNLAGRLLVPFIEKLGVRRKHLAVVCFVLMMGGIGLFAGASHPGILFVSAMAAGLSQGLLTTLVPLLLSEYCEEEYFSEQYGMLNTISFTCMVMSPLLVSASASATGGYTAAFYVLTVICGVSAVITAFLKKS